MSAVSILNPGAAGVEKLTGLAELYAANNRLTELRDVQRLRELSCLLILDLQGNPLVATSDYRLCAIYNARRLKARLALHAAPCSAKVYATRCLQSACRCQC
jgi:hypothetical protein